MTLPVIVVGLTGRGNIIGDLHSLRMWPAQRRRKGNTGAGNLFTGRVRMGERRGNIDRGGAETPGRGDDRRFRVRAAADHDGFTSV